MLSYTCEIIKNTKDELLDKFLFLDFFNPVIEKSKQEILKTLTLPMFRKIFFYLENILLHYMINNQFLFFVLN